MAELCHFPSELITRTRELQSIVKEKFLPQLLLKRTQLEKTLQVANSLLQSLILLKDSTLDDVGYKSFLNSIKGNFSSEEQHAVMQLLKNVESQEFRTATIQELETLNEESKDGGPIQESNLIASQADFFPLLEVESGYELSLEDLLPSTFQEIAAECDFRNVDGQGVLSEHSASKSQKRGNEGSQFLTPLKINRTLD